MTDAVAEHVREMPGEAALPRQNGELVFEAPWQGRVLGAAIDADPERPYYESWTAALEALVTDFGVATREEVDERSAHMTSG